MVRPHTPTRVRQSLSIVALLALVFGWLPTAVLALQATPAPVGADLTKEELAQLVAQFGDEVLVGGQVAPRFSRWVNDEVFIFLQLDDSDPAAATEVRYVGIGVKGVFCAETQPDPSFTHFHKYDAPEYAMGHGTEPGDQGYWLTWAATDTFETRDGRQVVPGIDYEFSPTPPPTCGEDIPEVAFDPPGAEALTSDEIRELAALFDSQILTGGQTAPRFHKWVNEDVSTFLQFDSSNLDEATTLRDIGITVPGEFCAENQPSADFPHFHQTSAPEYAMGHGSEPHQVGYWLLWVATDSYEARDGRQVVPGVDREFSPTPPPTCGDTAGTPAVSAGAGQAIMVSGTEFAFAPAEVRGAVGEHLSVTFRNEGTIPHTFTLPAADADTSSVGPGAEMTLDLTAPLEPGVYEFLCSFGGHPEAGMVGNLVVEA
jgi:plastocyanin